MRLADVEMSTNVIDLCECLPKTPSMIVLEIALNTLLVAGVLALGMLVVDIATKGIHDYD